MRKGLVQNMKRMRYLVLLLFIIGMSMPFCKAASADEGGYTIRDYTVHAVLQENNVLEVSETIQVDFSAKRHGIYRYIPTHMYVKRDTSEKQDGSGSRVMNYANKVKDLSVEGWNYETSYENGNYAIRIGDEDSTVEGLQTYQISYRYSMPDDRISTSDFLFYSVLGSGWKTTIDHFAFDVTFEKPLPDQAQSDLQIYSGDYGADENMLDVMYDVSSTGITGEAYDIAENQAITLFTNLPQGYFSGARRTPEWPGKLAMLLTVVFGVVILVIGWWKKDKPLVQTIEFHPPEGMSSAEVGSIVDESVDDIDLMSLIPWWAGKGYLTIEEVPDQKGRTGEHAHIILHRQEKLPADAPEYQKKLYKALFPKDSDTADLSKLKKGFAGKFADAKNALQKIYTGDRKLSKGTALAIVLVCVLCVGYSLAIGFSSQVSLVNHLPFGIVSGVILLALGIVRICLVSRDPLRKRGGWIALSIYALCSWMASLILVLFCCGEDSVLPSAILINSCNLVAIAVLNAGKWIHASGYKREMMGKLLGLRQFIQTAELSQLEMLVEENPSYYYDVLPYAMAFGMMDGWAKRFEGMTIPEPDWYTCGDDHTLFTLLYLNQQMNHHIEQPIRNIQAEAAAEAAASSSVSGGGFSGGGAGGGGGGSW